MSICTSKVIFQSSLYAVVISYLYFYDSIHEEHIYLPSAGSSSCNSVYNGVVIKANCFKTVKQTDD